MNNTTLPKTAATKGYQIYTPPYNKGDWYSYVMPNGKTVQLDHLITNINKKITVKYDWSFLKHEDYNNVKAESANKPKGNIIQ